MTWSVMSYAFGVGGNIVFFFEKQLLRSERAAMADKLAIRG
jgi:hypothetical protein